MSRALRICRIGPARVLCAPTSTIMSTLEVPVSEKHILSNAWLNRTGCVMFRAQCSGAKVLGEVILSPVTGDTNVAASPQVFLG